MKKTIVFMLLLALLLILASGLVACGQSGNGDGLSGTITEAGSTTVQPVAETLANAFMAMSISLSRAVVLPPV